LIAALGLVRGVAHAEFIQAHGDGNFCFLECAARVGGAYINEMVEAASGSICGASGHGSKLRVGTELTSFLRYARSMQA